MTSEGRREYEIGITIINCRPVNVTGPYLIPEVYVRECSRSILGLLCQ